MIEDEREATEEAPAAGQELPAAPAQAAVAGEGDAERGRASGERRRRHFGRRKVCAFCVDKVIAIDYKDSVKLRRYISDRGRIEARRKTGTCAKHQRWLAVALKRARHLALLPFTPEHVRAMGSYSARR